MWLERRLRQKVKALECAEEDGRKPLSQKCLNSTVSRHRTDTELEASSLLS